VKGRTRPSLGFPGDTARPCGFTVAVDRDAAQVTLRGPATGAGGGAYLTPVPGVELVFDRADGWMSGMTVTVRQVSDEAAVEAVAWIAGVFGTATAAVVRDMPHQGTSSVALRARPQTLKALSRLARLEAARVSSPVPASRLWDAETADLARQAGLLFPHLALSPVPSPATAPSSLGSAIPADVMRLLTDGGPGPLAGNQPEAGPGDNGRPEGSLDLGLVPRRIFRPGLWPGADLTVRAYQHGAPLIEIGAAVMPGATSADLADCRARLVDAEGRRTLATASFRVCAPSRATAACRADASPRAWAELPVPGGSRALARSSAAWVEVVGDERRPADGTRLRRIRRALRWADAALRAESRPNGLAPELADEQWIRLAALAWDHCRADWEAAGDFGRATLAATRGAATGQARPFLAELVSDPAVLR
jgi:hypothetical protein